MNLEKKTKKELVDLAASLQKQLLVQENTRRHVTSEKDLYKILAYSSQVGCYIMQDGRFQFINSHFLDYTGYPEKKLLKMSPPSLILPEDRRRTESGN